MNKVFPFQAYLFFKNQVLHLKGAFLIELPPFLVLRVHSIYPETASGYIENIDLPYI